MQGGGGAEDLHFEFFKNNMELSVDICQTQMPHSG